MTRVAVIELAGVEIEDRRERGDEEHVGVVARDFDVRRGHQGAQIGFGRAQRHALVQRLADRHENAGRQALARHVADQEKQPTIVKAEEIVQIAADFTRGRHRRSKVDPIVVAQQIGARQHANLNALRRFELAGHSRRLLARCLHGLLQQRLLVRRLAEGHDKERNGKRKQRERRRRRIEQPMLRAKQEMPDDSRHDDAAAGQQSRAPRRPTRCGEDQQGAEQQHDRHLGPARPRRTNQQRSIDQILDHLRLHFRSSHRLSQRRVLVIDEPEARDADQYDLAAKALAVDLTVENIDCGYEAPRIGMRIIRTHGAVALRFRSPRADGDFIDVARARLQLNHAGALRDAQQFDRQRRRERSVDVEQERNASNDAVVRQH